MRRDFCGGVTMWLEHLFYTIPLRLRSLFRRRRVERELDAELRYHVERKTEEFLAQGMNAEEARHAAMRAMDGLEQHKEKCRDTRRVNFVETLFQDVKYGLRMLRKSPGFAAITILTLALGIGANTAVFSVVNGFLLEPLPFARSERLAMVWEKVHQAFYQNDENDPSPGNFTDWSAQNEVFEEMAAIRYRSFSLTGDGEPVRVEGDAVSSTFFSVLRTNAALGRVFTADEDRPGERVAVIGHTLWASRYAADPQIVGKTILLDGQSYTVVGVLPETFHFPDPDDQIWVPLALSPTESANHGSHYLRVIARLKPEATLAQARAQMEALASRLAERYPETNAGQSVSVIPLREQMVKSIRPALLALSGAVALVLLIVCANVAGLLLARGAARYREIAVRISLGAGPARICRQLLTESFLLALLGGCLGLLLARWGVTVFRSLSPQNLLPAMEIHTGGPILLFHLGISLFTGLLFGMSPALRAARSSLQESLRNSSGASYVGRRLGMGSLLVIGEVSLAVIVVAGSALLLRSFLLLERVPLGFHPQGVLTFRVIPRGESYAKLAQRTAFYQQTLERIVALPGVRSAAAVTFLPLYSVRGSKGFSMEGRVPAVPGQLPMAEYDVVTPGYFQTMEVPLLEGRDFSWADTPLSQPVIIINQAMARMYWPNEDPLNRRLKQGHPDERVPWLTVAGVVGDMRQFDVATAPRPTVYFPASQFDEGQGVLRDWVLRTSSDPLALAPAVRGAVWSVDKNQPISRMQTMEHMRSLSVAPQWFHLVVIGFFGGVALILALIGVYGVMSQAVERRTRELGIRVALGAQPHDVLCLVVGEGAALAGIGISTGMIAALGLTRLIQSLLFGVDVADPLTFTATGLLLAVSALAACYIPARRAMRVDPMTALRYE